MSGCKKNKNKGFTLMEVIAALIILILSSNLVLASVASIQQMRLQQCAQIIKSQCESTRELAKSRGTNAELLVTKVEGGFQITVAGDNVLTETQLVNCGNASLFYKKAGMEGESQLGVSNSSDPTEIIADTIKIVFAGGSGDIIGQPILDYIILANGSKNQKLLFQQNGGLVYYDYDSEYWRPNDADGGRIKIELPYFTQETVGKRAVLVATGDTIQPEFAYNAQYVKVSGIYREKQPSDKPYVIVFELKDPYTTTWVDGTTDPKVLEWVIVQS